MAAGRARTGCDAERQRTGQHGSGAAGGHGDGDARGGRHDVRERDGRAGAVPRAGARGRVSDLGGAAGVHDGAAAGGGAAAGPAGDAGPGAGGVGRAGDGDGHGRSAAHRHDLVQHREQHRPAADAGPAAERPELDGPDAAVAGEPDELGDGDSAGPTGVFSDERGRAAGDVHAVLPAEPAAVQPGRDCRVRADDEPVRRDEGADGGDDGERHHEVGDEHAVGDLLGVFPG